MSSKRERVTALVRKLDAINEERERLARDAERIEKEIDALVGESPEPVEPRLYIKDPAQPLGVSRFSKAGLVLEMIKAHALPDIAVLAIKLYGESTTATRNRARSVLHFLEKRQRLIRKTETGNYEFVATGDA